MHNKEYFLVDTISMLAQAGLCKASYFTIMFINAHGAQIVGDNRAHWR